MTTGEQTTFSLAELLESAGLDSVEAAFAYDGGSDMTIAGLGHRQRRRLVLTDPAGQPHTLFMKCYGREPLSWRLKRWFTYGAGGSPAEVELANILALHSAGIATIDEAFARCDHEHSGRNYIVMTSVPGEALEQCFDGFIAAHGLESDQVAELTRDIASLVRRFHEAGYVHRDLYTSHIFLDASKGGISLHLIDLARMFAPRWRRFRWRVKDLAEMKYSAPPAWIDRYWSTLMDQYCQGRSVWVRARYARAVDRKVGAIARGVRRKRRGQSEKSEKNEKGPQSGAKP